MSCIPSPYCDISITVTSGLSYITGDFITLYCSNCNYISGQVVSYNIGTGALVFTPISYEGTGTCCDWTINLSGATGTNGTSGTAGTSGTSGGTGSSGSAGSSGSSGTSGGTGSSGSAGTSGTSGITPDPNARNETTFTATAGQTVFAVTYNVGQVDVYYNGSKLAPAEFTATSGTSITLATPCLLGDIVNVVAYVTGVTGTSGTSGTSGSSGSSGTTGTSGTSGITPVNQITGTGTTNFLPKFTAVSTIGDSLFYDNGTLTAVGNRVSTNSFVGLVRNFNVLGTDAAVRVARYTDSYATLHPTVELLNYSDDGVYRRFYWDNFVDGNDSYAIRQRLTGGGVTTNGTVIDQTRLMIFSGGNVGIATTTDAGFKLDVNGTGRFSGALTGTSATFSGLLTRNSTGVTQAVKITTTSTAGFNAITIEDSNPSITDFGVVGVTSTANKWFLGYQTSPGVLGTSALTWDKTGAVAISGALSGTSATFSSTATASAFIPSGASVPTNGMYLSAANTLDFATNSTNRLSITSGGDVGIGTTTPQLNTNAGTFLTVLGTNANGWLELATTSTTDGFGGAITFNNTNVVGSDKRVGQISVSRAGANNSADMSFLTWNAGSAATRLTITSGGNVGIGTTSPTTRLHVVGDSSIGTPAIIRQHPSATALLLGAITSTSYNYSITHDIVNSGSGGYRIYHNGDGQYIQMIAFSNGVQLSSGATSWAAISDQRVKIVHSNLEDGTLDKILALRPIKYNYIDNEDLEWIGDESIANGIGIDGNIVEDTGISFEKNIKTRVGFLAQEVKQIINDNEYLVNEGSETELWKLSEQELIPYIIKAIQELKAEIDLLKGIAPIESEAEPIVEPTENETEPQSEPNEPDTEPDTETQPNN